MRVVVPFTHVAPETAQALAGIGYHVEFVDVSGSDTAYWELLAGLWEGGETFVLVEQDVKVAPGTLDGLEACPNAWCAATYPYLGSRDYAGLGCTKFAVEFCAQHPDLVEVAGRYEDELHAPRHWCVQDAAIQMELRRRGVWPCLEHGRVGHRDGPPSHGCC